MGKLASQAVLGNQLPGSSLPSQRGEEGWRPALESDGSGFKSKPQHSQDGLSGANYFSFLHFRRIVSTCTQWALRSLRALPVCAPHSPTSPGLFHSTLPTGENRPPARQRGPTATSSCLPPRAPRRGLILVPQGPGTCGARGRLCSALQWSSGLETGCWGYVSLRLDCCSSESRRQGHPHSALLFQGLQAPEHLYRQPPCPEAILLPGPPPRGTLQLRPKASALSGALMHPCSTARTPHQEPPPP